MYENVICIPNELSIQLQRENQCVTHVRIFGYG